MTATKDQEREALAKIRKIVESLGAGSYLEMTFSGVFEQAEENINNDFGNNYKELYEAADARHYEAMQEIRDQRSEIQRINEEKERYINACREHQAETEAADARLADERQKHAETFKKLQTAEEENKALKAEIITLKAKLYDLITA